MGMDGCRDGWTTFELIGCKTGTTAGHLTRIPRGTVRHTGGPTTPSLPMSKNHLRCLRAPRLWLRRHTSTFCSQREVAGGGAGRFGNVRWEKTAWDADRFKPSLPQSVAPPAPPKLRTFDPDSPFRRPASFSELCCPHQLSQAVHDKLSELTSNIEDVPPSVLGLLNTCSGSVHKQGMQQQPRVSTAAFWISDSALPTYGVRLL